MNAGGMVKTCKSNAAGAIQRSGERASNAFLTYPGVEDSPGKLGLILDDPARPHGLAGKGLPLRERETSYQLVGEVTAHQGCDG